MGLIEATRSGHLLPPRNDIWLGLSASTQFGGIAGIRIKH